MNAKTLYRCRIHVGTHSRDVETASTSEVQAGENAARKARTLGWPFSTCKRADMNIVCTPRANLP